MQNFFVVVVVDITTLEHIDEIFKIKLFFYLRKLAFKMSNKSQRLVYLTRIEKFSAAHRLNRYLLLNIFPWSYYTFE